MKGIRYYALCIINYALFFALSTFAANIETDRTWYLAGEAMRVSITIDDAMIAYAELCDTYSLAAGTVISVKEGKGTGIIELPANLHSGYYVLSVYTRHSTQVSQQLVAIVNPLHKSADDDIEWVTVAQNQQTYPSEEGNYSPLSQRGVGGESSREVEGHIIKARVQNVYKGNTFKGSQIRPSLSIVGKQIHYFEGKMVNDSIAVFYTYGIHGKQPLVLAAASSSGESLPIEMISPFATLIPKQLPHLVFHYNRSEVEARSLDMQRHQIAIAPAKRELQLGDYSDDTAEDGVPLDYDDSLFGTRPYPTYNLDEYRQFLTIREVLIEYVNCVRKTKIDGVTKMEVRNPQDSYDSSWPAMVLIDGMPVIDIERLLDYDARRIHYINIYGNQYTFGNGVYNGILSFVTRSGRLTNYPIEPNMQYLVYEFPQ
ncbi:MAG: hypothetical protein IKX65_10545 [Prevotella sp.]|nr:hypothetical protein [Prevotella sp.]